MVEVAEAQIERMIEKRARKGETAPDEREDLWVKSVRRFRERAQQENRARWYAFHTGMCELHLRLSQEHAQKAEKLCQDGGASEATKGETA